MSVHPAGTKRSFESLYQANVNDVYRYAFAVTGNANDAEDVTQTTFMNAYRAFTRGERPLKPQNWLLTIAHNVCRQRARLSSRRPREVIYDENVGEALVPPDDVPTATDIRRALAALPYEQRATLIMRELEGRSHAEIAEILGVTTQATEMLAFRARRALREHLAGTLTCTQAEDALDRQSDGRLDAEGLALLRTHLRECPECERLARRLRAQRGAWKALGVAPMPASLATFNAGGGAAVSVGSLGAGMAAKAAAVTLAAATVGGGAVVVKHELGDGSAHRQRAQTHDHTRPPRHTSRAASKTATHPRRATQPKHAPTALTPTQRPETPPTVGADQASPVQPVRPAHPVHPVRRAHPVQPVRPVHPVVPAPAAQHLEHVAGTDKARGGAAIVPATPGEPTTTPAAHARN